MNLTKQEFVSRKSLVDLVVAYHVIPGGSVMELISSTNTFLVVWSPEAVTLKW
jgi:hypothetical protein